MPKQTKATAIEKNQRIELVVDMLLKGQTRAFIHAQMHGKYGLSERNTDYYIQEATERIGEVVDENRVYLTGLASMRLDDLYYQSYKAKNYEACRRVIADISKLFGLNAPVRIADEKPDRPEVDLSIYTEAELDLLVEISRKMK